MNNHLKKLLTASLISSSLIFTGCGLFPSEEAVTAPPVNATKQINAILYKAKKGSITNYFRNAGSCVSSKAYTVSTSLVGKRVKQIDVQVGQAVKKGTVLLEFDTANLEQDIRLQELTVESAELAVKEQQSAKPVNSFSLENAQLNLKKEQTRLNYLREDYDASKLVSTADGEVTAIDPGLQEGGFVYPYTNLFTIGDTSNVDIFCSSTTAAGVSNGQKVDLVYNSKHLTGTVISCPSGTTTKDEHYKDGILIKIDNNTPIPLGSTVDINIKMQEKNNVLVIPKAAVKTFNGQSTVRVVENNIRKEVPVKLGISTATEYEITQGLTEGQEIVIQ